MCNCGLVLTVYISDHNSLFSAAKRHSIQSKEEKNNGGTWPKARAAPVLTPGGGTVVTRTKERPPLSLLPTQSNQLQENYNYRNSTPVPLSIVPQNVPTNYARHSVYKSVDNTHHFGIPTDSFERLRLANTPNRLSVNVNSDNSLDFPVQRFVDKELMSYYKKTSRSGKTNLYVFLSS